jgi:hypothetical protein
MVCALGTWGCNVFSFAGPSGDDQLLSAARACLDNGDFQCATSYYEQLSSADADIATSEMAFEIFDQQGAGMSNFTQFVGDLAQDSSAVGKAITNFAERLQANGTYGESSRVAIWTAFDTYNNITDNSSLAQFVRFVGSFALVGEMLAETQGTDSELHQSDLVLNATSCLSTGLSGCATNAACGTGSSLLSSTATSTQIDGTNAAAPTETHPSADHLNDALDSVVESLTTLGAQGKFGSALSIFTEFTQATAPSSNAAINQCFRYALISQGVGY